MTENILHNIFVKTIIVPILFTAGSALIDWLVQSQKGTSEGEDKYRVWVKENNPNSSSGFKIASYVPRGIGFFYSRTDVVHVENLINLQWSDFGSVALNLIVGAFSVDIASLIDKQSNEVFAAYVLIGHGLCFIVILILLAKSNQLRPDQEKEKDALVKTSILIGFVAMMIAFFTTSVFK